MPVAQPVVDDPEGSGLVVALAEVVQQVGVQGGAAAGTGVLYGLMGLAQDGDDLTCDKLVRTWAAADLVRAWRGSSAGACTAVLEGFARLQ